MKVILLLLLSLVTVPSPTLSHGSKDDCSSECNDYYCPPEMHNDKEKNFSGSKQ